MTKTELKTIIQKIQNRCGLEEPSKVTYYWNDNDKVVFKIFFDSLYLPAALRVDSDRLTNAFLVQDVYEYEDDFKILGLNQDEGFIEVLPDDQHFKVIKNYKDANEDEKESKKEVDEKKESVRLAGKKLNENLGRARGYILYEEDEKVTSTEGLSTAGGKPVDSHTNEKKAKEKAEKPKDIVAHIFTCACPAAQGGTAIVTNKVSELNARLKNFTLNDDPNKDLPQKVFIGVIPNANEEYPLFTTQMFANFRHGITEAGTGDTIAYPLANEVQETTEVLAGSEIKAVYPYDTDVTNLEKIIDQGNYPKLKTAYDKIRETEGVSEVSETRTIGEIKAEYEGTVGKHKEAELVANAKEKNAKDQKAKEEKQKNPSGLSSADDTTVEEFNKAVGIAKELISLYKKKIRTIGGVRVNTAFYPIDEAKDDKKTQKKKNKKNEKDAKIAQYWNERSELKNELAKDRKNSFNIAIALCRDLYNVDGAEEDQQARDADKKMAQSMLRGVGNIASEKDTQAWTERNKEIATNAVKALVSGWESYDKVDEKGHAVPQGGKKDGMMVRNGAAVDVKVPEKSEKKDHEKPFTSTYPNDFDVFLATEGGWETDVAGKAVVVGKGNVRLRQRFIELMNIFIEAEAAIDITIETKPVDLPDEEDNDELTNQESESGKGQDGQTGDDKNADGTDTSSENEGGED